MGGELRHGDAARQCAGDSGGGSGALGGLHSCVAAANGSGKLKHGKHGWIFQPIYEDVSFVFVTLFYVIPVTVRVHRGYSERAYLLRRESQKKSIRIRQNIVIPRIILQAFLQAHILCQTSKQANKQPVSESQCSRTPHVTVTTVQTVTIPSST